MTTHTNGGATPGQETRRGTAAKILNNAQSTDGGKRTRGQARAEQIVQTAQDMFHENGYTGTSMDDIAREVGILKGSLYYYMDSKEDLLYHIAVAVHEVVDKNLAEVAGREDLTPLQRLLEYLVNQMNYNTRNKTQMAVYHHEWRRLSGERYQDIVARRRANEAVVIDLLEQAKKQGEVAPDLDSQLALVNIFAVIIWPYTWYKPGGPVTTRRLAEFCANFVLNGLAVKNQTTGPT